MELLRQLWVFYIFSCNQIKWLILSPLMIHWHHLLFQPLDLLIEFLKIGQIWLIGFDIFSYVDIYNLHIHGILSCLQLFSASNSWMSWMELLAKNCELRYQLWCLIHDKKLWLLGFDIISFTGMELFSYSWVVCSFNYICIYVNEVMRFDTFDCTLIFVNGLTDCSIYFISFKACWLCWMEHKRWATCWLALNCNLNSCSDI